MTILIVEDDFKTGDYPRKGLRESGYAADLARTGTDGLHMARQEANKSLLNLKPDQRNL